MFRKLLMTFGVVAVTTGAALADGVVTYPSTANFDDTVFALENAIIGQGLVVDHTSHVGAMLERTRADVGSDVVLYDGADVLSFCSASLSRKVMEADLMNIRFCPYDIFVMKEAGKDEVLVGYRTMPEGAMQDVQALLDMLAREAAGVE